MTAVCQVYLAVLSMYHVLSGALSYFWSDAAMRFYKAFYGSDPVERRHLWLILKPWGALSICAGIAGLSAVPDPREHRGVVLAILVLLMLRIGYRLRFRAALAEVSRIPSHRNVWSVTVLAAGVAILGTWLALELIAP